MLIVAFISPFECLMQNPVAIQRSNDGANKVCIYSSLKPLQQGGQIIASYSVMDILQGCGHKCMGNCKPSFKLATVMD